jgi:hypothetical protein
MAFSIKFMKWIRLIWWVYMTDGIKDMDMDKKYEMHIGSPFTQE